VFTSAHFTLSALAKYAAVAEMLHLALQQVGQVMLALPHAISLMGLRAACVIIPCYTLFSMWTMHLLTSLYVEYKARKVLHMLYSFTCVWNVFCEI
jgi:hypothetical protein